MSIETGNAVATVPKSGSLAERRAALAAKAAEIEEIASGAMIHFSQAGSMADELAVAQAIVDLKAALTPDIMRPIMALMNTDLGFKTDRDPAQINTKTNQPNVPYPVETVVNVVIEAKLRGFRAVGNEFNIIAGRFYAAQNGFFRKLTDGKSFPGLSGFRDSYGLPKITTQGATVVAKAQWTLNGKPDSYEQEFGIKVNAMMGADAIIGKARRKLCKRVHDILLGINTPDAEVDDDGLTRVTPLPQDPPAGFNPDEGDDGDQIPGAEAPQVRVVVEAPTKAAQPAQPQAAPTPAPTAPEPAPAQEAPKATRTRAPKATAKAAETVQGELGSEPARDEGTVPFPTPPAQSEPAQPAEHPSVTLGNVVVAAGFTFEQFKASPSVAAWFDGVGTRPKADDVNAFDDVPRYTAEALLGKNNGASVVAALKRENALPNARE